MKRFFAIILVAAALVSCKPLQEQITVNDCNLEGLDNVSLASKQLKLGTSLTIDAENESCQNISVTKLYAELFNKNDKRVATIELGCEKGNPKPTLHRRSSEKVSVPLLVGFDSPLSVITLGTMSLDDFAEKGYTVTYDATLKAGLVSKRFRDTKVPVAHLVKMLER